MSLGFTGRARPTRRAQKIPPCGGIESVSFRAGDRTRTGDVQLGKLAFYQLNYARDSIQSDREPQVRIELTTARLRIGCSTHELLWQVLRNGPSTAAWTESTEPIEHLTIKGTGIINTCAVPLMPWSGLEPLCLTAPPPQDGVSTNFTTRATSASPVASEKLSTRRSFKNPRGRRGSNPRPLE